MAGRKNFTLEELAQLAVNETAKRLRDPERAASIKDPVLFAAVVAIPKLLLANQAGKDLKHRSLNVLQIVQAAGLPADQQVKHLREAIELAKQAGQPDSEIDEAEQALKQLMGGGSNGDGDREDAGDRAEAGVEAFADGDGLDA